MMSPHLALFLHSGPELCSPVVTGTGNSESARDAPEARGPVRCPNPVQTLTVNVIFIYILILPLLSEDT
jgi:hypothetical protein